MRVWTTTARRSTSTAPTAHRLRLVVVAASGDREAAEVAADRVGLVARADADGGAGVAADRAVVVVVKAVGIADRSKWVEMKRAALKSAALSVSS